MGRRGGWTRTGSRGRFRYLDSHGERIDDEANAIGQRIKLIAALGGGFDARTAMAANTRGSGL